MIRQFVSDPVCTVNGQHDSHVAYTTTDAYLQLLQRKILWSFEVIKQLFSIQEHYKHNESTFHILNLHTQQRHKQH